MSKGLVGAGVIILMGAVIAAIVLAVPTQIVAGAGTYITSEVAEYNAQQIEHGVLILDERDGGYIEIEIPNYKLEVSDNRVMLSYGDVEVVKEFEDIELEGPESPEELKEAVCIEKQGEEILLKPEAC